MTVAVHQWAEPQEQIVACGGVLQNVAARESSPALSESSPLHRCTGAETPIRGVLATMAVPRPRDAASDEDEDFHSGRDSGGDENSVFSDSDDDANVVLQPPGSAPATGEQTLPSRA